MNPVFSAYRCSSEFNLQASSPCPDLDVSAARASNACWLSKLSGLSGLSRLSRLSGLSWLQHSKIRKPFLEPDMPGTEWNPIAASYSAAVSSVRVDMHLGRDSCPKQRIVEVDCRPRMRLIIAPGARQKSRSCIFWRRDVHRGPAWIYEAREIGTATLPVDRVCRISVAAVESNIGQRGKRAPGREPQYADPVPVNAPFLCAGADNAERALSILERFAFDGVLIARSPGQPV